MPSIQFKGKTFVQNHHLAVPFHQLVPQKDKSLTDKVSLHDNLIIQGDNLLALKALLPTYAGKVKCIYIDPPYNTGNEGWVYNDNVKSPIIKEWIGQVVGKEGEDLTRHDKWLCMMLPRLKLLRELLTDDGAIMVSIDHNEVHRLQALLDEVYGEHNYVSTIANISKPNGRSDDKFIATSHESILIYAKDVNKLNFLGWEADEVITKRYTRNEGDEKYREVDLRKTGEGDRREDRPNMFYPFYYNKKTEHLTLDKPNSMSDYIEIVPFKSKTAEGRWRWGKETAITKTDKLYARYMPVKNRWSVFEKDYLSQRSRIKPISSWAYKDVNSERGTEEFIGLGFDKEDFYKPKPVGTVKRCIQLLAENDDIVLDSFAGSGTTAQAVLELNKEDDGNRKFILVEMEDYADKTTAERVRRVIKGVPESKNELVQAGLGGSFSYFELGDSIEMTGILNGKKLPSYLELARYVYYTATGEEFNESKLDEKKQFVGSSSNYDVHMLYKPDIEYLKQTALTLNKARELRENAGNRPLLVFAPTKYVESSELDELKIDFCQLPFEIYKVK